MDLETKINLKIKARNTCIILLTHEEEVATDILKEIAERNNRDFIIWDIADGFKIIGAPKNITPQEIQDAMTPEQTDPAEALKIMQNTICEKTDKEHGGVMFLLRDFHLLWENPVVMRKLRNVTQEFAQAPKTIFITTPFIDIPQELRDNSSIIDVPLPDEELVYERLDELAKIQYGEDSLVDVTLTDSERKQVASSFMGLTKNHINHIIGEVVCSRKTPSFKVSDIPVIIEAKKAVIREGGSALNYCDADITPEMVGGLDCMKEWLDKRTSAFGQAAKKYGLPSPKGIALIGIPGTGKSLTAKMVANKWDLPLIRLDVGALFGSLVGESEERVRNALKIVERIAQCVLWIDEMEKALAHGSGDSGTSMRVFGTILTWMSEKEKPVFVCATANDVSRMPPELLRKGRFDEIFFLDLPSLEERKEIFKVHILKRKRKVGNFSIVKLAKASAGFVGSEIEQSVIDAMYTAFADNEREVTTDDIMVSLEELVPLSISQASAVTELRRYLEEGRAKSATFKNKDDYVKSKVTVTESKAKSFGGLDFRMN